MDVINWLTEDSAPPVAYLARHHLLGEDTDSRKMKSLWRRRNEYTPIGRTLNRVEDCITKGNRKQAGREFWGNYKKYEGAYWTLIILSELRADGRDGRIRRLTEHVLATQLPNGGFSASGKPSLEIVCLTANVLRAAVQFGYGNDDRVIAGYQRLMARILPHRGVPCMVLDHVLITKCIMTLPQTLRCLAVAPHGVPKKKLKETRDLLVKQLLDVHVYRYVRPDFKTYQLTVSQRPKGVLVREVKANWLAKHKVKNKDLLPKQRWLRFGFPRSYNPDLLEAMLALAELGVRRTRVLDDALDHIESKRGPHGRWTLDDSLNGKMLANIEQKGRPSKWITLRAMIVLKHFGRMNL